MTARLALVAYRCEVNGVPSDALDLQVRYFDDPAVDIEPYLRQEPVHSYRNAQNEVITWLMVDVLAMEELTQPSNGGEVLGFITSSAAFATWTGRPTGANG
jgi:hypothetical protein